jgi:hypothetical protein
VYIDTTTGELVLGEPAQEGGSDNRFDLGNIENNKDRIVSRLQQIYHNVNDKTLSLGLSEPFYEFYMADNQLKEAKWKNYQTYLLSNKGADGKTIRSIKETPLNTSVSKKTDEVPYNYKQKYAILEELDFPKTFTGTPSVAPSAPVVDTSVKDYPVQGMGNLQYTATPREGGGFDVSLIVNDTTTATISAIVANPAMLEAVKDNLRDIKKYVPGKADRDYVIEIAPNLIETSLIRAQAASAPAAPTAPVVSDIEAKKAELKKQIEALPDDMIYGAHVTGDDVAKNIYDTQFKYSLGTALQGTVGLTSKKGLLDLMNNLLDGKSPHRNQFGVFILAFPKSEFGETSADRKVNLDTIESDMLDNYPEFLEGKIPTKFNFGYFKDGILSTKNAELAALEGDKNFDDVPTPEDTPEYRMVGSTNVPRISEADLAYYRDFMKKVAPNLPFEVLDNMIEISPTEQAWGAFEKVRLGATFFIKSL